MYMVSGYLALVLLQVPVQRAFPIVIRARRYPCRSLDLISMNLSEGLSHEE